MLNLVQIQDRLKDMPTQAIMAYANGQNPMVPPYLALGELNRRKNMEQAAMGEQAKMQGEPPTIKQATEEQLGLMNLQKQRAMQGQQRMGQSMANAPSPVPAGVGEQPVQMARGGIARLPVRNFRRDAYAHGGIVAFANNEDQPVSEDMPSEKNAELEKIRSRTEAIKKGLGELLKAENLDPVRSSHRLVKEYIMDPWQRFISEPTTSQAEKFRSYSSRPEQAASPQAEVPIVKTASQREEDAKTLEAKAIADAAGQSSKIDYSKAAQYLQGEKGDSKVATPAGKQAVTKAPVLSDMERFEKMLKDRGLDVAPESGKGIEALRKSREQYERPVYKDWTEGLLGTVQDIRSGQAVGSSRAKQEKENKQALADLDLKVAQAEDLKAKSDYEFKRGNFDKAVEYERAAQKLANETMTAKAHMISATKSPAEIQMIERVMKEKGISFTDAIQEMNLQKGISARLKSAQDKWNSDPVIRMIWEKKGGYNAYLQSEGLPPQAGAAPASGVNSSLISKADAIVSGKK